MKFKSILFFYCCVGFLFLACKNVPNQDAPVHLYTDYYVRFLASTQQLKAEAQFTEGIEPQTAQFKTIEGGVLFQEKKMEIQLLKKNLPRYIYTDTMTFPSEIYFQYGSDHNLHRENLSMHPIERYKIKGSANKESGLTLITNSNLLKGNESLVVLLADANNKAASFTINGPVSDTIHQIPQDPFQGLQVGPGSLYLVKRMKKTMEQAHQTVTATLEYYTDTLRIQIQE